MFGHSLPVFRIFIEDVDHWVLLPLLAWFFEIRFDLDVIAGVSLHPCRHGIHVLFQGGVLYPKTMVCVSAG